MFFKSKHLNSINAGHYKHTAGCATEVMPVPASVRISMSQNIGAPCQPLVKKGDTVLVGQKIGDTDAFLHVPVHSSVSGKVTGIETQRNAMGGMDTLVCIETDGQQTMDPDIKPPVVTNHKEFVDAIKASGLVGLGGASFPTWLKFNPKDLDGVKVLIINGAECEPFITSDHRTMLEDAQNVIDGALAVMKYLEIEECYIGIEDNKQDAIDNFESLFAEQGIDNVMHTFPLRASYPKGAERVLIYEVTGLTCDAGVLPADLGCIVSNVPLVKKRMTVDGDSVSEPKNIVAPLGTEIRDVIEFCGGYRKPPKKILMGGPMMGRADFSDRMPIVKNNNAILAFSREQAWIPEETACINCGRCHKACPFGLLPTGFADAYETGNVERLNDLKVMQCMECGSCSYVCPAHRPLAFMNKLGKAMVREASTNGK